MIGRTHSSTAPLTEIKFTGKALKPLKMVRFNLFYFSKKEDGFLLRFVNSLLKKKNFFKNHRNFVKIDHIQHHIVYLKNIILKIQFHKAP